MIEAYLKAVSFDGAKVMTVRDAANQLIPKLENLLFTALRAGDMATVNLVANGKSAIVSFLSNNHRDIDEPELVADEVLRDLATALFSPANPASSGIPFSALSDAARKFESLCNPIDFVNSFNLVDMGLGFCSDGGIIHEGYKDANSLGFKKQDIIMMMLMGAKVFGHGDDSFIGVSQLPESLKYNPIIAGINRSKDRFIFNSNLAQNYKTSEDDLKSVAEYDRARLQYYGDSPQMRAMERATQYTFEHVYNLWTPDEYKNSNIRFLAKELSKPSASELLKTNNFDLDKIETVNGLIVNVTFNRVALTKPSLRQGISQTEYAAELIKYTANLASFHSGVFERLSTICQSHIDNGLSSFYAMDDAQKVISLYTAQSLHFEIGMFDVFDHKALATFMRMAAEKLPQAAPGGPTKGFNTLTAETGPELLLRFVKYADIRACQYILPYVDRQTCATLLEKISTKGITDNVYFTHENSESLAQTLGLSELAHPGVTKDLDLTDISKRCKALPNEVLRRYQQIVNQPKVDMLARTTISAADVDMAFAAPVQRF